MLELKRNKSLWCLLIGVFHNLLSVFSSSPGAFISLCLRLRLIRNLWILSVSPSLLLSFAHSVLFVNLSLSHLFSFVRCSMFCVLFFCCLFLAAFDLIRLVLSSKTCVLFVLVRYLAICKVQFGQKTSTQTVSKIVAIVFFFLNGEPMKRLSRFTVIQRKREQNVMSIELESIRGLLRTINNQFCYRTGGRARERERESWAMYEHNIQSSRTMYRVPYRSNRSFIRLNPDNRVLSQRT